MTDSIEDITMIKEEYEEAEAGFSVDHLELANEVEMEVEAEEKKESKGKKISPRTKKRRQKKYDAKWRKKQKEEGIRRITVFVPDWVAEATKGQRKIGIIVSGEKSENEEKKEKYEGYMIMKKGECEYITENGQVKSFFSNNPFSSNKG